MKNLTISLPEAVYRRARIIAAEQDTSVSALVRRFLMTLGEVETNVEFRKRLQREVQSTIKRFRAGDRLSRDRVHDRDAIR